MTSFPNEGGRSVPLVTCGGTAKAAEPGINFARSLEDASRRIPLKTSTLQFRAGDKGTYCHGQRLIRKQGNN